MGDPTAELNGRLTLNPIKHLDPIGTMMLLFFRFGWAKPVPINPNNFKDRKKGIIITSLAGPLSNLLMAIIGTGLLKIVIQIGSINLNTFIFVFIYMNVALAIFNLLPIPPLDGSHLITVFVKNQELVSWLNRYGMYVLMGVLFLGSFTGAFSILKMVINPVVNLLFAMFGIPIKT
ncbi:MAG: site-2 protease family protein [Caldisericia bacterium]|nr:site-2 protease family protein [Caldisericia bacterium]